ncbi:uncharacterized protein LOC131155005 isoform X2 [Malania oleifera]|uniref:uncharacterized protein LOC131155005 isoform X2 n=1 Tax=Malania oleifera TaxID=397392 RepID=UPI0025ADD752|nr:uncharacterized protein LOC131155005 isoform X2 [Malania oleifera]
MATTLPTNATTTTTTTSNRTTTTVSSMFLKSVYLHDWWLVKANNKRLAVGGFAYRGSQGIRGFYSAAIAKRHDATTLETIDGVTIVISGLINRSRTYQNGFPSEVSCYFPYTGIYVANICGSIAILVVVPLRGCIWKIAQPLRQWGLWLSLIYLKNAASLTEEVLGHSWDRVL